MTDHRDRAVKYPNAIAPAFGVFGRTVRDQWPLLAVIIIAYCLARFGLNLGWQAIPVAPAGAEAALKALAILAGGALSVLLGVLFTVVTLAVADRRRLVPGEMLAACGWALPVAAISVLLQYGPSIPTTLWREQVVRSDGLSMATAILLVSLVGIFLTLVVGWLVGMAVPIRLDRRLSVWGSLKASADLGRRRWRTVLGALLLTGLISFVVGLLLTFRFMLATPENGRYPDWLTDKELWALPVRAVTILVLLYWSALYAALRDPDGVAATFD
ncbi:MAG: hypothetical protein JWR84_67 [Caulobacter sp.]|nr:hypothetical protein [Caulobacter sp.]